MADKQRTISGGFLVFFDGIDGVGKTTQLQQAQADLKAEGWLVESSRIHGGTPIGEALRQVSFSDLPRPASTDLYISLAIHQALLQQTKEWRQAGALILIDRSPLSIVGYQMKGDGLDAELGWRTTQESMKQFAPELTIVYSADVPTALARARQKEGWADHFGSKPASYFKRAQAGYLEAAERFRAIIIDANQPADSVHHQTMALINKLISD